MPVIFPMSPATATQVASRPGSGFLNIQETTYKKAVNPYTKVTTDKMPELFMLFPLS